MVIVQEICQRELQSCVFLKRGDPHHQAGAIAVGRADIVEYVFCRLFLQLNITAFRQGDETILNLTRYAARSVGKQRSELILKVVFAVCLTDEVQNGQAFLIFGQTEPTTKLL